jgi:glycolate oxidase
MKSAARAIRTIFRAGFLPSALEVADEFTLRAAEKRTGNKSLAGCRAHLIVELDGQENSVSAEIKRVEKLLREIKPLFVQYAIGAENCEKIWQLRRDFPTACATPA